ncbi:MAG: triosephosphate isomerase [Candidatus Levybacteria bacterium]|nr:triosephosphate isomerase [Candidatus Levybacteria bacterium]
MNDTLPLEARRAQWGTPLVIANHKANKTLEDLATWLKEISQEASNFSGTIILCPANPFLASAAVQIKSENLPLKLGAQNVSKFSEGPYTGEFAASQIRGMVNFAIIGHSERNKYFGETDDDVIEKIKLCLENQITPIFCIRNNDHLISYLKRAEFIKEKSREIIFVYEPPGAISSQKDYKPDTVENIGREANFMSQLLGSDAVIIYGGSINPENTRDIFSVENIKGGLVGQASLDPSSFKTVIKNSS